MTVYNIDGRLAAGLLGGMLCATAALAAPPGTLPFGVYDPNGTFIDDPDVSIEHLFLPWESVSLQSLYDADDYAVERGRSVLFTIEPWTWTKSERNTPEFLIEGIKNGTYDGNMAMICAILNDFKSPVTVRWAHEMDSLNGQFTWALWEPESYITAYKRMVDVCRTQAPNIDFMWSPLGENGLQNYFPGKDYVDVVGLSVFGLQAWDKQILGKERTFREVLEPRYDRVLSFGLPIVVAELGVSGDAEYVDKWLKDVRQDINGLKELVAVIYFNQTEVHPWPDGFGMPDWRFGHNVIEQR